MDRAEFSSSPILNLAVTVDPSNKVILSNFVEVVIESISLRYASISTCKVVLSASVKV